MRLLVGESGQLWGRAEQRKGEKDTECWLHYLSAWIKHCLKLELPLHVSLHGPINSLCI